MAAALVAATSLGMCAAGDEWGGVVVGPRPGRVSCAMTALITWAARFGVGVWLVGSYRTGPSARSPGTGTG